MQLSPDEICRLAYAEKPLPTEATVVDRSLYAEVRRLYDAWSVSKMTKEACASAYNDRSTTVASDGSGFSAYAKRQISSGDSCMGEPPVPTFSDVPTFRNQKWEQ